MAKKDIKTILKSNGEILENMTTAIINDHEIKFKELDALMTIKIHGSNIIILRSNDTYELELNLQNKKTTKGYYLLKEVNMNLTLDILTEYLEVTSKKIHMKYRINDDTFEYLIDIKE